MPNSISVSTSGESVNKSYQESKDHSPCPQCPGGENASYSYCNLVRNQPVLQSQQEADAKWSLEFLTQNNLGFFPPFYNLFNGITMIFLQYNKLGANFDYVHILLYTTSLLFMLLTWEVLYSFLQEPTFFKIRGAAEIIMETFTLLLEHLLSLRVLLSFPLIP